MVTCPRCSGKGWIVFNGLRETCPTCDCFGLIPDPSTPLCECKGFCFAAAGRTCLLSGFSVPESPLP